MARSSPVVLLGYDDEQITEKYKNQVNFTTNKIGGKPDFPRNVVLEPPVCQFCQLPRPLVVQIYAPLDTSSYHRTLYLFACINPNCWNHNESWICIRSQTMEQMQTTETQATKIKGSASDWCPDADDWDDANANVTEENGNVIGVEKTSDDDESCSMDDSMSSGLMNLSIDDTNANSGAAGDTQGVGAVGRLHSPSASAEIEGDEGEIITIDSPALPQTDIPSLLQEALPLPRELLYSKDQGSIAFHSYFISVWDENDAATYSNDSHIRELLQEYQQKSGNAANLSSPSNKGGANLGSPGDMENYEKSTPAHGDKMFHHFLSRIQRNPGHVLRYSRDEQSPLLMHPFHEALPKCQYCQGDLIFEFQILPTLIPKLRLVGDPCDGARLEYGTVLVFTCRQSCWSTDSTVQKEFVVVQAESY